ncbi:MAG: GtrA family protein [Solirubrobacterales bacterium]|nr:GtrA family protein [Solirubrobacterales bacterium]MBV9916910.1 GtrA family protein [Solirubrobacterales bacterium]
MPEELTSTVELPAVELPAVELPFHVRLRVGARQPDNWLQLVRFVAVGASGYVVNLAVFAAAVHMVGIDYRVAAVVAWIVSVVNNFWLNRHWTFDARHQHPVFQAMRFFAVSLVAFGFTYLVLVGLVDGAGMDKVPAQALAVVAGTPLSFLGQKLWSFRA